MNKEVQKGDALWRYTLNISKDGSKCEIKKDKLIVGCHRFFNNHVYRDYYYLYAEKSPEKKYTCNFKGHSNICIIEEIVANKLLLDKEDVYYALELFKKCRQEKIDQVEEDLRRRKNQLASIESLHIKEEDINGYF